MVRERARWRAAMPGLDPERLVFVDETWASTAMTRRYGRSPSGTRLVMPVPHGHGKTTTFVAGLRADGLVAPTVVDGAINGELFEAYVRQQLVPTLRPGDAVAVPIEHGAGLLVGEIVGEYLFQGRELLPHRRPARWDRVVPRSAARPPATLQDPRALFQVTLDPQVLGR